MSKKEEKQEELQEEMEAVDAAGVSEVEVEATEIENLKAELSEMEDKFVLARAEIANMSNRNKNERELLVRYRSQDLGKKILPSIDNLERAMAIEVSDEQGESLKKGISMVLESITVALKEEGITVFAHTGSYEYPTVTLTDSINKDICSIEEIIGVKLALSDHRAPNVSNLELQRLASDARVEGM